MKLVTLNENTSDNPALACENGLSLYLETRLHRLLVDTGATSVFAENAGKLGVDLAGVDTLIITHGHYDHGGGLRTFLERNDRAKVYMSGTAFGDYYARRADGGMNYIGLDKSLLPNDRFVFCAGDTVIDNELMLFAEPGELHDAPSGNRTLYKTRGSGYENDDFAHELNLIVTEGSRTVLITACGHRGIVNIVGQFHALRGRWPDVIVGGFHLYNGGTGESEDPAAVRRTAEFLLDTGAACYTCHCTGLESYRRLRAVMGERISYLSVGRSLTF